MSEAQTHPPASPPEENMPDLVALTSPHASSSSPVDIKPTPVAGSDLKCSRSGSGTRADTIAVFCGSSFGFHKAYRDAAVSLGAALGRNGRTLVFGGTDSGIMGVVSRAAREGGAHVVGVTPHQMVTAGGEGEKVVNEFGTPGANEGNGWRRRNASPTPSIDSASSASSTSSDASAPSENVDELILTESMHARKVEMANRAGAFVGLPGGYGTYEEIMEAMTWTQLGIHNKPVVVINVLGFFEPLRHLIRSSIRAGFIRPESESLVIFVDGPPLRDGDGEFEDEEARAHEGFDWGEAALRAVESWDYDEPKGYRYDWSLKMPGSQKGSAT